MGDETGTSHREDERHPEAEPHEEEHYGSEIKGGKSQHEQAAVERLGHAPGNPRGGAADQKDEQEAGQEGGCLREAPGNDGVGDVQMLGDKKGVAVQRRGADVRQIVAGGG